MSDENTTVEEMDNDIFAELMALDASTVDEDGDDLSDEVQAAAEEAQDKADEQDGQADKYTKKFGKKLDSFEKRFETTMLKSEVEKFIDKSDDIEKGLMKELVSEIKTLDEFEKAEKVVRARAAKLREVEAKYAEEAKARAEEAAARAWGVGPIGKPAPQEESQDEVLEKINAGDSKALFRALYEGDAFFNQGNNR